MGSCTDKEKQQFKGDSVQTQKVPANNRKVDSRNTLLQEEFYLQRQTQPYYVQPLEIIQSHISQNYQNPQDISSFLPEGAHIISKQENPDGINTIKFSLTDQDYCFIFQVPLNYNQLFEEHQKCQDNAAQISQLIVIPRKGSLTFGYFIFQEQKISSINE